MVVICGGGLGPCSNICLTLLGVSVLWGSMHPSRESFKLSECGLNAPSRDTFVDTKSVSRLQPHTCKPEQILRCPSKEPVASQRAMGSCGNGKKFLEIHTGGRMEGLGYGLFRTWGDTD